MHIGRSLNRLGLDGNVLWHTRYLQLQNKIKSSTENKLGNSNFESQQQRIHTSPLGTE